jgi:hypothetical protein
LELVSNSEKSDGKETSSVLSQFSNSPKPVRVGTLPDRLTDKEQSAHQEFINALGESAIWHKYQ